MRSKLFVPGSRPELFEKAAAAAADALSFDLEDAVAESRKVEARALVADFIGRRSREGGDKIFIVRVNAVGTPHFVADMRAVVGPNLGLINLPMVEDASAIEAAADLLDELEGGAAGGTPTGILVNIETPKALRRAAELASAHPRNRRPADRLRRPRRADRRRPDGS